MFGSVGSIIMLNKRITSIEIENTSWALCSSDEIVSEILKIYRNGDLKHFQYNGMVKKPVNAYIYKVDNAKIEEFFNTIVTKIKIQDWKDDYSVEVCDGKAWECRIRHFDNTIKKVIGTVEPPPRGKQLINLINKLADYKVKPWIF